VNKNGTLLVVALAIACLLVSNAASFGDHKKVDLGNQFPLGKGNSYELSGIAHREPANEVLNGPDAHQKATRNYPSGTDISRQTKARDSGGKIEPAVLGNRARPTIDLGQSAIGFAQKIFRIFM